MQIGARQQAKERERADYTNNKAAGVALLDAPLHIY